MPDPGNDWVGKGSNNVGFDYDGYGSSIDGPNYGQTRASDSDLVKQDNKDIGFSDFEQKSGLRETKILDPDALAERLRMRDLLEDAEDKELWDYHNERNKALLMKVIFGYMIYLVF